MAAAAYAARKNFERKQKLAEKRRDHKRFIDDVMKTWDKSHSGFLDEDELKNWLTGINSNVPVTQNEARWVIWMCQRDTNFASLKPAQNISDNAGSMKVPSYKQLVRKNVRPGELPKALQHWMAYRDAKPLIDELIERYDTAKTGAIDKDELKKMLTDLNEGEEVSDEACDFVMEQADALGTSRLEKVELGFAISLWYHLDSADSRVGSPALESMKEHDVIKREHTAGVADHKGCGQGCSMQ